MSARARLKVCGLVVLGTLLLQTAWILVMPPFGGMDEFDHAYHASAVGHGELRTDLGPADDGRGHFVTATEGIVRDAAKMCHSYEYLGTDNCYPGGSATDGRYRIASASAVYPPTYYASVGWVTQLLDGNAALYAMRILTALTCATLLGTACWITIGTARTRWPLAALLVTLTPTALYSSVIVAPNGLEIFAALVLWSCAVALAGGATPERTRRVLFVALPSALLVAFVRPFGPIWLFFILAGVAILLGGRRIRELYASHTRTMVVSTVSVGSAAAAAVAWVLTTTSHDSPGDGLAGNQAVLTLKAMPLWFLQSISGVPFRNTPSPTFVYAAGLALLGGLLLMALRLRGRTALSIAVVVASGLGVGAWYTYTRVDSAGYLWQGRYSWCLAIGAILIAGLALERARRPLSSTVLLSMSVLLLVMHLGVLGSAFDYEQQVDDALGLTGWPPLETVWVLLPGALGIVAFTAALRLHHDYPRDTSKSQMAAHGGVPLRTDGDVGV